MGLFEMVEEAVRRVRQDVASDFKPRFAIILGTGLGALEEEVEDAVKVPYETIPHFVRSTVESHSGRLVLGYLSKQPVVMMSGRFHLYEGYSPEEVTFPVRVMRALGADTLLISNAAGGLNPQFEKADIMIIEDHINLTGQNPLVGPNDERLGPRFPDMSEPYSKRIVKVAKRICLEEAIPHHTGVYVGLLGPNLETRAEYRFLRTIGADAVGLSTVMEVIAAVHAGFKVGAFSIITDMCLPDALKPVTLEEIVAVANTAQPRLSKLMRRVVEELAAGKEA